jgi:hypothetical protein
VLTKKSKRRWSPGRLLLGRSSSFGTWAALLASLLISASALSLAACGSSYPEYPAFPETYSSSGSGEIQQPTTINLYPSSDGDRLYVMVTEVGSQSVSMPLAFDTGSAGITLYAPAMQLPSTIFNSNGFIVSEGQRTIVYNGITITNQNATRSYGGPAGKTETGNIGFARVTFGDTQGTLTTDVMTVFLYYLVTYNAPPHAVTSEEHQGWFGVNTEANLINVTTPTAGAPVNLPCSPDTAASCYVIGVLKHLQYAPWLDAGFSLSPYPLQACAPFETGSCSPAPMLTVGLTSAFESNFSQVSLTCPQPSYLGPDTIDGFLVCDDQIPFSSIEVTTPNNPTLTLNEAVLFDSGNQAADIVQSSGTLLPMLLPNTTVSVVTPSGFTYTYTAQSSGTTKTTVATSGSSGFGINFFTEHSLFIDFANNTEGWM